MVQARRRVEEARTKLEVDQRTSGPACAAVLSGVFGSTRKRRVAASAFFKTPVGDTTQGGNKERQVERSARLHVHAKWTAAEGSRPTAKRPSVLERPTSENVKPKVLAATRVHSQSNRSRPHREATRLFFSLHHVLAYRCAGAPRERARYSSTWIWMQREASAGRGSLGQFYTNTATSQKRVVGESCTESRRVERSGNFGRAHDSATLGASIMWTLDRDQAMRTPHTPGAAALC